MDKVIVRESDIVAISQIHIRIVELLADDLKVAEVAQKLNINVRTLEASISRLKLKTGTKTLYGLVSFFYKNGLIDIFK
jgi:DNA-binding NarL/FixJ family response regulator